MPSSSTNHRPVFWVWVGVFFFAYLDLDIMALSSHQLCPAICRTHYFSPGDQRFQHCVCYHQQNAPNSLAKLLLTGNTM